MRTRILSATIAVLTICLWSASSYPAAAQNAAAGGSPCTPERIGELIDETGAFLRNVSRTSEPALLQKFEKLARARNWPSREAEERGYELIQDDTITGYDNRARQLLIELDKLGAVDTAEVSCADVERLEAVTRELRTVTEAKIAHVHKRLDQALGPTGTRQAQQTPPATDRSPAPTPPARTPSARDWQTSTTANAAPGQPPQATPQAAPQAAAPPGPGTPRAKTYSTDEIAQAGRGLFGTLSANLASVIRYAFATYGKPNGYIVGTEGGGALLAGLSYGSGRLHTKMAPPTRVYWQGPTVGYDLGITGSRVLFLVYNLEQPDDIFRRFGGIGGSAYVIGGVGLTFHQQGSIILAPIRTGLGLRIGANIGYLKFTPERSFNPF